MKVFKHYSISTSIVLLCASVIINILLAGVVYVSEKHSHVIAMALERRNIITLEAKSLPDYWAIAGWTNTVKKLNTEFDVAFFGNSITRGSDFQTFFPNKKIINLGYSGDNVIGMLRRVDMLQASHPKKIFIMAGTNDLFHITVNEFADRYDRLLNVIQDSIPTAKIYIESILPMNHDLVTDAPSDDKIQQANKELAEIAKSRGVKYLDIYSLYVRNGNLPSSVTKDGIHLLPYQYGKWAKLIEPYVNE